MDTTAAAAAATATAVRISTCLYNAQVRGHIVRYLSDLRRGGVPETTRTDKNLTG